jgi:hypothetical protein
MAKMAVNLENLTLEGFFLMDYERMRNRVQELEAKLGERVPAEYGCFDQHKTFDAVKVSVNNSYYLSYPEYGFTVGELENAITMTDDELWAWGCTKRKGTGYYSSYTAINVEYHKFQYTLRFRETRADQFLVTDGEDEAQLHKIIEFMGEKCLDCWQDVERLDYIKAQALEFLRDAIKDNIPKLRGKEAKAEE